MPVLHTWAIRTCASLNRNLRPVRPLRAERRERRGLATGAASLRDGTSRRPASELRVVAADASRAPGVPEGRGCGAWPKPDLGMRSWCWGGRLRHGAVGTRLLARASARGAPVAAPRGAQQRAGCKQPKKNETLALASQGCCDSLEQA